MRAGARHRELAEQRALDVLVRAHASEVSGTGERDVAGTRKARVPVHVVCAHVEGHVSAKGLVAEEGEKAGGCVPRRRAGERAVPEVVLRDAGIARALKPTRTQFETSSVEFHPGAPVCRPGTGSVAEARRGAGGDALHLEDAPFVDVEFGAWTRVRIVHDLRSGGGVDLAVDVHRVVGD